jgi:hypothetical protein
MYTTDTLKFNIHVRHLYRFSMSQIQNRIT